MPARRHDCDPDPIEPLPAGAPGLPAVVPRGAGARSGWAYTDALGASIADLYADTGAGGLWELCSAMPDRIPPPAVVRAWCGQFPQFGLRMKAAESVRAERMLEESVVLADTAQGQPARVALMVSARQYLAERLDKARFGRGSAEVNNGSGLLGQDVQPVAHDVSDEALARIAVGVEAGGTGGEGGAL